MKFSFRNVSYITFCLILSAILLNIIETASEKVISAFAISVIGFGAGAIAFQQWRTNHLKVKYDYFEKRHKIYIATRNMIDYAVANAAMNHMTIVEFSQNTRDADFLFGADIHEYLTEVRKHAASLNYACSSYRDYTKPPQAGYDHALIVQLMHDESLWFTGQQHTRLSAVFKPYLDLSKLT